VIALHKQTGVEVPEADYGQIGTAAAAVDYIAAHTESRAGRG
jgi:hypothetical protein